MTDRIYPQFATHNAHTVAAILAHGADDRDSFEFQRLHGMGEALHETVRKAEGTRCRIYAPVGAHPTCSPISSAGCSRTAPTPPSSTRSTDEDVPPEEIARDPFEAVESQGPAANPAIPRPAEIFGAGAPQFAGLRHHRSG